LIDLSQDMVLYIDVHVDTVRLRFWTAAANGTVVHTPGDI